MNPLIVAITILYFGAAAWDAWHRQWALASIWWSYGTANIAILILGK